MIEQAIKKHEIHKLPNVVGYSNKLQPKIKSGKTLDIKCVRIYVSKKVPESQLKPSEVIPKTIRLEDGTEICTDVVEIGVVKAQQLNPRQRWRPAPAGVSTSRADEMAAGTIGWFVVDEDANIYAISNNHVWAGENAGKPGDPLVQPGRYDGGDPDKDVVYTLTTFIPLTTDAPNTVDVAVATPLSLSQIYTSILNIGGITGKAIPSEGDTLKKMGRTTGLTEAVVIDTSATIQVEYTTGTLTFTDIILTTKMSEAGDSGSPVLTRDNQFTGLLFAGSNTVTATCKYTNIETALTQQMGKKVRILTANSYPPFFREVQVVHTDNSRAIALSLLWTILTMGRW